MNQYPQGLYEFLLNHLFPREVFPDQYFLLARNPIRSVDQDYLLYFTKALNIKVIIV
jgi:hypothetical protein